MKADGKTYFNNLNYTLGNEDSFLEFQLLSENLNHVFAVAGSGSRIIPLLAKKPRCLTCVDTSKQQLYFTQLRIESLRLLDHEDFLAFWGYPQKTLNALERKKIFQKLPLSQPASIFITKLFEENKWESLLYTGRWERTFIKLSKLNRLLTSKRGQMLFDEETSSGYFSYLKDYFPHKRWKFGVFLFGNALIFNTLLYKGNFPKKNIPMKLHEFYLDSFKKLFNQGPVRNNFFLQLLFFGRILFPEGNPLECDPKIFLLAKKGLQSTRISYVHGDVIEKAADTEIPIDFFSFSDAPSYFDGEIEKNYLQKIHPNLSPNSLLIIRYYLHLPEGTLMSGFEDITSNYSNLINQEKIQMYSIKILKAIKRN